MTTIQKFFLHQAGVGIGGTLPPASSQSATAPSVTAAGATTNRLMDASIGASQVSGPLTTLASATKQNSWFRRFCSKPLADQTIASGTWQLRGGLASSNVAAAWQFSAVVYVWRPSNGTLVGTIVDAVTTGIGTAASGATEVDSGVAQITASGSSVVVVGGDILVVEMWGTFTQTTATSRTWTPFYDGTVEGSVTTNAAYLNAPAALTMLLSGSGPGAGSSSAAGTGVGSGKGAGAGSSHTAATGVGSGKGIGTGSARAVGAAVGSGRAAGAGTSSAVGVATEAEHAQVAGHSAATARATGRSPQGMSGGRIDPRVDASKPGKRSRRLRFS